MDEITLVNIDDREIIRMTTNCFETIQVLSSTYNLHF